MFKFGAVSVALLLSLTACDWEQTRSVVLESNLEVLNFALTTMTSDPEMVKANTVGFKPGKVTFKLQNDDKIEGSRITLSQYQGNDLVSAVIQAKGWAHSQFSGDSIVIPSRVTGLNSDIRINRYDYTDRCKTTYTNPRGSSQTSVDRDCWGESTYFIQFGQGAVLSYSERTSNPWAIQYVERTYSESTDHKHLNAQRFDNESMIYLPKTASLNIDRAITLSPRNSVLIQWQAGLNENTTQYDYYSQVYPRRSFCSFESAKPVTQDTTVIGATSIEATKVIKNGRAIQLTLKNDGHLYLLTCAAGWKKNASFGYQYVGIPTIGQIRQALQETMTLKRSDELAF